MDVTLDINSDNKFPSNSSLSDDLNKKKSHIKNLALVSTYLDLSNNDERFKSYVLEVYQEELNRKHKEKINEIKKEKVKVVNRRAPVNPLDRKTVGVKDPALKNNPLRGRLIALFSTTFALFILFWHRNREDEIHKRKPLIAMNTPTANVLYSLGALSTNDIRNFSDGYRLFSAAWLHKSWLHISFNVLCQIQYFFMYEPDWGFVRSFGIFVFSELTGNLLSANADPCTISVGSSGGVFGLMGALIPYHIEFWDTIPRPIFTIIFSLVIMFLSVIIGFFFQYDNWAHIGGLIGGALLGLATITTISNSEPLVVQKNNTVNSKLKLSNVEKKKVIHRSWVTRQYQKRINPNCKCGLKEWIMRSIACTALIIYLIVGFSFLYVNYEFTPPGSISFTDSRKCICCYVYTSSVINKLWYCQYGDYNVTKTSLLRWSSYCVLPTATKLSKVNDLVAFTGFSS